MQRKSTRAKGKAKGNTATHTIHTPSSNRILRSSKKRSKSKSNNNNNKNKNKNKYETPKKKKTKYKRKSKSRSKKVKRPKKRRNPMVYDTWDRSVDEHKQIQAEEYKKTKQKKREKEKDKKKLEAEIREKLREETDKKIQEIEDKHLAHSIYNIDIIEQQRLVLDQALKENEKLNKLKDALKRRVQLRDEEIDKVTNKLEEIIEDEDEDEIYFEIDEEYDPDEKDNDIIYGVQLHANKKYKRYSVKVICLCIEAASKIKPQHIPYVIRLVLTCYTDWELENISIPTARIIRHWINNCKSMALCQIFRQHSLTNALLFILNIMHLLYIARKEQELIIVNKLKEPIGIFDSFAPKRRGYVYHYEPELPETTTNNNNNNNNYNNNYTEIMESTSSNNKNKNHRKRRRSQITEIGSNASIPSPSSKRRCLSATQTELPPPDQPPLPPNINTKQKKRIKRRREIRYLMRETSEVIMDMDIDCNEESQLSHLDLNIMDNKR